MQPGNFDKLAFVLFCYKSRMLGLTQPKLPINSEERSWIDQTFVHLADILGAQRLLHSRVMLPTPEHFPDAYDGSEAALQLMFKRVAPAMLVDPSAVDVTIFREDHRMTREMVPFSSWSDSGASGLYYHERSLRAEISINEQEFKDPEALVAVLAHELGHVVLLRPGLVDPNKPDMEPMNDLLTVFLGLGVFTANAAFRFHQHTNYQSQGWSTRRLGYLSEEMFGYALARFAFERDDPESVWAKYLKTNVASYMKRSCRWFVSNRESKLFS